jgi:hypothetical protein
VEEKTTSGEALRINPVTTRTEPPRRELRGRRRTHLLGLQIVLVTETAGVLHHAKIEEE